MNLFDTITNQLEEESEIREFQEACHIMHVLTETETYSKQMEVGRYKGLKGEKIIVGKDLVFFYDTEGYCISVLPREYVNPLHFCFNTTIKN